MPGLLAARWPRINRMRLSLAALLLLGCGGLLHAEEPNVTPEGERRFPLEVRARDEDGDQLKYAWTQLSGPTKVKIADPNSPKTWFTTTEAGEYVFEIRVSDGKDEAVKKKVWQITMPNQPPVAMVEREQKAILTQKVVLDGSDSTDKDGKISEYQWTLVSAPPEAKLKLSEKQLKERKFSFEPTEPGDYIFELKVSDGKDWSAPAQTTVKVAAINKRPVIDVAETELHGEVPVPPPVVHNPAPELGAPPKADVSLTKPGAYKPGEILVLDGSASTDPMNEDMEYFWRQVLEDKTPVLRTLVPDKASARGNKKDEFHCPVWKVKVIEPGTYKFVLEVSAGKGDKLRKASSAPVEFKVGAGNRPPTATFVAKDTQYEKGKTVTLDATLSSDPDNDKLEYFWGWSGKGNKPRQWIVDNGPRVQFIAEEEGNYGIRLIVGDGQVKSAPYEADIKVGTANRPPEVDVPKNIDATVGETVRISAKVSDPDQDPVTVEWKVVSPPSLKLSKEALAGNPLIFTPTERQVYAFSFVARDHSLSTEPKIVQVSVADNVNLPPTAVVKAGLTYGLNEKIVLDGSESSDPEKKRLTYVWKQLVEGNGPKIPGNPPPNSENKWEFIPSEKGAYQVSLTVSDGVSESRPHLVTFQVEEQAKPNQPPIATVLPPPSLIAGEQILLNGAGSTDPDKDPITYKWRVLEGAELVKLESADQPKLSVKTLKSGKARFELIVNDGKVDSAPVAVDLEIGGRREPPMAMPSGPLTAKTGEEVVLSGAKSTASGGSMIEEYQWGQLADGGPPLGLRDRDLRKQELRFKADKPGSYVFQLVVVDDKGMRSKPSAWTVNVEAGEAVAETPKPVAAPPKPNPEPEQPKADPPKQPETMATAPEEQGSKTTEEAKPEAKTGLVAVISELVPCEAGGELTLDGAGSKPGTEKSIEEYRWECVAAPEGAKVSFGFLNRGKAKPKIAIELPKDGEYTFELKVSNGKQWSEPVRATVKTRPPNVPPAASVVALTNYTDQDFNNPAALLRLPHVVKTDSRTNTLVVEEGREVLLDASGSADPDKSPKPLVYKWKQLSGPQPEHRSEDGPYLRFKPARTGIMVWDLLAFDGKTDSPPAQVRIQVLKSGTLPVAIPAQPQIEANVAVRGQAGNFIVLSGQPSRINPATKPRAQFAWRQIGGDDLQLRPEQMAKEQVGLRIYHPGRYRFMLTIKDGELYSLPAIVDVIVKDPAMKREPEVAPRTPEKQNESGALLPPPRHNPAAQRPKPEPEPAPEPKVTAEKPITPSPPDPPKVPEKPVRVPETVVTHNDVPETKPEPKTPPKPEPTAEAPHVAPPPEPVKPVTEPVTVTVGLTGELADPKYRSDDPLYQGRKKKLEQLVAAPGEEPQALLIQSLNEKDKDLRRIAAHALVQRGMSSAQGLIEVLENGTKESKAEAHWALQQLSRKSLAADPAEWRKWWTSQTAMP